MATFQQAIVALREIAPVLAIAGNHDGAGRVGHFACLLRDRGIHLVATEYGQIPRVVIPDEYGDVHFHLMPFALLHEIRHALSPCDKASAITFHQTAIAARLATTERTTNARHVLVGHLFTQAGYEIQESESERDISVGRSSAVLHSTFEGFSYEALGHLHKPHDVVAGRVRYAGSLGRYSFSEETHEKSVSIVELDPSGYAAIRTVPLRQTMGMQSLRGPFADVFDSHTGSSRPARTLSGGETFLASLSMALALAEVVAARRSTPSSSTRASVPSIPRLSMSRWACSLDFASRAARSA